MTDEEKTIALAALEVRATTAERAGLPATARSWRRYAETLRARPAAEVVVTARAMAAMRDGLGTFDEGR